MDGSPHGPANQGPLPGYLNGYSGYNLSGQDGSEFPHHDHATGVAGSSYEEWTAPGQSDAQYQHAIHQHQQRFTTPCPAFGFWPAPAAAPTPPSANQGHQNPAAATPPAPAPAPAPSPELRAHIVAKERLEREIEDLEIKQLEARRDALKRGAALRAAGAVAFCSQQCEHGFIISNQVVC